MCGINGFNWQDKKLIKSMNNSLKHRGPDAEGEYLDKKISLGHRRLSIIDLSKKANQPMNYDHNNKKVIIVYNGEIYNFKELRDDLGKKGYKFASNSDTEVILASYLEYGFECVKKFNGMWAFCIYDLKKNIIFLSRDRFGKKPLYYFFDEKKFIFSSELKGILKHKITPEIKKESIDLYLSLGFIPAPYSIYKNIYKLEASQNLIFDLSNHEINKYFYYHIPEYFPIKNKKELIRQGKALLKNAVKLRLVSDVPLGAFLSGGIDSSSIVAQMSDFIDLKNLNTFSIGFEGKYDESTYSKLMKNLLKTKHHHEYFSEKDFNYVLDKEKLFYYYDEPFSEQSMFPTFNLSKLTRKYVTVALSGDGGDEIFSGYSRYKIAKQLEFIRKLPLFIRKLLLKVTSLSKKGFLKNLEEGLKLSLLPLKKFYSESRTYIYKPEITKKILDEKMSYCLNLTKNNLPEAVRLMDIIFYTLPDRFLLNVDRASMSNSLEVRCPFLDYRLLEYSMKIPSKWKLSLFDTKIILKDILKKILPNKILKRKKVGFTPPLIEWINKSEYTSEIKKARDVLYKEKIINREWKEFYNNVIDKKDDLSKNYKIRLFLLYKWWEYWKTN